MSTVRLPNPHLADLTSDYAFHLDIPLDEKTAKTFSDVKFVFIGGTAGRMRSVCVHMAREIYGSEVTDDSQLDFALKNDRYSAYKKGAVFCVSHGIGLPSLSIVLHEVFKLLERAGVGSDVKLIRIGTSGGVGVVPGSVVITEESLNDNFQSLYVTSSFGKPLSLPVVCDPKLNEDLQAAARNLPESDSFPVLAANTFCAVDFYQGQGRLDGSFSDHSEKDKQAFLKTLYDKGVRNIEMESAGVLALSHRVGIQAAVICVTLVDRILEDLPSATAQEISDWIQRPIRLATEYVRLNLQK